MFDFTQEQKQMRQVVRRWVKERLEPAVDALESGATPPFELMRDFIRSFGIDEMVRGSLVKRDEGAPAAKGALGLDDVAMSAIVAMEQSRVSPGFAMSMGASLGLCGGAILRKGTPAQRLRFGVPLLTGEKIGAWAITEPHAGSDALGGMRTTARRTEGGYLLNGQKAFITNAPFADTLLVYAKLEHQEAPMRERPVQAFVVESHSKGVSLGKPMKKMGMCASPTGEVFLDNVFVPANQLLGEREKDAQRDSVREVFHGERTGIPPMTLGIIERCLDDCLAYVKQRETWGRPISEYQLVQEKLARMYIHRQNVLNMVFKTIWAAEQGTPIAMGEACAMKAYCAPAATEVAMEAVQIMGGNGYMSEYRVEQLARDAKLLQIGGGTDEIQLISCAKALLRGELA